MTRRAAIYCRISKDRAGAGLGVERQETDCRQLAERLGWDIVAVHADNDVSAYSGKPRPGYRALLDDLESGAADAVIAWHNDRLHRSPAELETFIGICEAHTVAVQTVTAGEIDLSTPSGRAVARTVGAWARHEVEHSIDRQKLAKQQAAAAGKYRGGTRPYGYLSDGVTPVPTEAVVVREMTERVLLGESLQALAREMNDRELKTSRGGKWTPTELRRLIMRPRNAAIVEHRGKEVADAQWPPIVDRDTWRAARTLLEDPSRRPPRASARERFLGSGLYVCGVCNDGTTMLTATSMSSHRRRPAYICRNGPHLSRLAESLDEFVTELVIERLKRPDVRLLVHPERAVDAEGLQHRSIALRARLDELGALFGAGEIDARQLTTGTAAINRQLGEITKQLAETVAGSPLAGFLDAEDVRGAWDAATIGRRKAVVRELMTVTILKAPRGRQPGGAYFNPDYIDIAWKTS
jgi:site-specific DNA recombinase